MSIDQIVKRLYSKVEHTMVPGPDFAFQFHLTGADGGDFYAKSTDGRVEMAAESLEDYQIKVTLAKQDLMDLLDGKIDAMSLYFQGKVRIEGDIALAMKLANLFR